MTFPWHDGSDISFAMNPLDQPSNTPLDPSVVVSLGADQPTPTEPSADDEGFTDDEIAMLLSGNMSPLGVSSTPPQALVADAETHTGGMIALLPTIPDQERLAVPGGEDEEELHLTLFYLGDAAKITPHVRDQVIRMMQHRASEMAIVDGDGFAVSLFNPTNQDKETCVVLGVSGDELARAQRTIASDMSGGIDMVRWPDQHAPWIPHVTLAYSNDESLVGELADRTGPIRFDVLRVVFGDQVTDFPLYDGTAKTDTAEVYPVGQSMAADSMNTFGVDMTLAKERDVNAPGPGGHDLLNHWVHGPGAAKIGWGTTGAMKRCIALLGEKGVKSPGALCATYHHAATGEWPTKKGGVPSAVEIAAFESEVLVADSTVDIEAELGEYDGGWEGPMAVEDSDTGDGRMFSGGSLTWGDTVETIHPFQWAPANLGAHQGSVTSGRIDALWRDPQNPRTIMGKGRFNVNDPDGLRAFQQVRDGFAGGVSIDPDQIADADVELEFATEDMTELEQAMAKPTKTIFHAGRIRGATLVAFPALVEASIKLTKKSDAPALVASIEPWKSITHEMRLPVEDGQIGGLVASGAFAFVREYGETVHRGDCRFLHHEIAEDGEVGLPNLVACAQHIASINSGRTFGLEASEIRDSYEHMAAHFHQAGQSAPVFTLQLPAAVVASIVPVAPLEWFGNPNLSGPTPITVTEDGRVFGHAAAWNSCHTGFADTCVSPPLENDYGYFTTGEVLTAEGHRVAVGQITLGTSHAATRGLSVAKAIDHYGDTGTAVADVTAGTDDHGIWIAGAVRASCSVDHIQALRASALSGDWRRIGGSLRMVALLAVNVPGFPIPRTGTALAAGKQLSLVASGVVDRTTMTLDDEVAMLAGSCGIPLGGKKKKMTYETIEAEVAALVLELEE